MASSLTPIGRASYPKLVTPDTMGNNSSWSVMLVFDESDPATKKRLDEMRTEAANLVKAKWPDKIPKNLKNPFKTGTEEDGPNLDGMTYMTFRTKSTNELKCYNAANQRDKPEIIYPGCKCRVSYSCSVYDRDGNRGVSFYLNGIQFTGDAPRFDSRVSDDAMFDALETEESEALFG